MPVPDPKSKVGSKKFDLFGQPKTNDIQVGYISPDRGYVQGASICEANDYAKLNPGTTFIIKNRKKIEYKNINEVNKLTPDDVFVPAPNKGEPARTKDGVLKEGAEECGGIQPEKECGVVKAEFFGGGGVGVKGNPVIGDDGAVLAVHLVSGGHGYQYAPLVKIEDKCQAGGGAVAKAHLGELAEVEEIYSAEDEFEEYFPNEVGATVEGKSIKQLCTENKIANDAGYGRRYSVEGKDIGPWDPSMYVTFKEDPIARQIEAFQEYLNTLTDPWWFLRKKGVTPLNVISDDEAELISRQKKLKHNPNRTIHPVHHWHWGGSEIKVKPDQGTVPTHDPGAFLDEVFEVYTAGGQGRGLQFTFTEVGGSHTFIVKADNYGDNDAPRKLTKTIKPNVDYKVTSQGSYRNKGTEQGLLLDSFGGRGTEKGLGTANQIFADFVKSNNDNDDLQILAQKGKFKSTNKKKVSGHSTYDLVYRLNVPFGPGSTVTSAQDLDTGVTTNVARSFMNDHAISPIPMSNAPGSDFAGMMFTMEWEEEFPHPGEYIFKGQCDNIAGAYLDGQPLMPKVAYYKDKPTIVKKNLDWEGSDTKGKVYKIKLDLLNSPQYKDLILQEPPQPDSLPPATVKKILCHAGGGKGGTDNQQQLVGGKVIVGKGGDGGSGGDDDMYGGYHGGLGGGAGLRNGGSARNPLTHEQIDAMGSGKYKGGPGGFGVNFVGNKVGTIEQTVTKDSNNTYSSGGDGVAMGGGGGGGVRANIGGRGGHGGNGGVRLTWGLTGKSQEWTIPGTYEVTVPGNIGDVQVGGTGVSLPPSTVKFEGTNYSTTGLRSSPDTLDLVVEGGGPVEVELKLTLNDKRSKGYALTELKCGDITLSRTRTDREHRFRGGNKYETSEELFGTATFSPGRHKIELIGATSKARSPDIGPTKIGLKDRHGDDHNATITFTTTSQPQSMAGVTIVCIGGGGSGYKDQGGDKQGSGGSGGAYAWVNEDLDAGTKLKVVVGKGGQGTNVQGGNNGSDSYVEVIGLPPKPPTPKPKPTIPDIKVTKVFNTVDWMGKANRQLWRTNIVSNAGFINASGVCPFDTNKELDTNPYAGTHEIIWPSIDFPVDGNYTIKVAVDDSVNLTFNGPSGEIFIRKEGFANKLSTGWPDNSKPGNHSTGTSTYTRFFKKGKYKLQADLEQIPGGRFGFRHDAKGKKVKDKEVKFTVTGSSYYANKITIPGLFSTAKQEKVDINENFFKLVEVGKEYDVIFTSTVGGKSTGSTPRLRFRDSGGGGPLSGMGPIVQMEDLNSNSSWDDLVCQVDGGVFYSAQGNKCKFKVEDNFKGINPMALAVDIEVAYATKTVISAKSWQENPMGIAFTIKAPHPPVPTQKDPVQEGRCPNNPMWTTRFAADTQWYPVRMDEVSAKKFGHTGKGWSDFLNRWAISPALPLNTPGSDEGGKVFTNTWNVDIPYDGWYQLKGEVDDIARYYIDDDLKLDLSRRKNKVHGASKFFLTQGLKKLKIEVENYSTITYKNVDKKILSARDWRRKQPVAPLPPSDASGVVCHAGGGKGGTDDSAQLQGGKVIVGQGGAGGPGGDDDDLDKHHGGLGGGAGLRNGGVANHNLTHTQIDQQEFTMFDSSAYRGGPGGYGVNFQGSQVGSIGQIFSTVERTGGNGVAMGGGGGGNCRGGSSGSGGNGGVKITWGLTGKSQEWTTPGTYKVTVPGNIGKAGPKQVPVTAKFEGTNINDLALVVSGTGTCECTLLLDTNDNYGAGHSVTEMRCGDIILTRVDLNDRTETFFGTGTFVGGKKYPIQITETGKSTGSRIVSSAGLSSYLFKRENLSTDGISDTRIELDDDAVGGFDINASINLRVSSSPQPMDGVTIVCIGGGGSGFMDGGGDRQGSGGSGGAYAWVNKNIAAGQELKIVVGKGGQGKNVQGGENGGDSYVKIISEPPAPDPTKIIEEQKGKVSYKGPNLFHFKDSRWGKVMNESGVSPANPDADLDQATPYNVGRKTLEWTNVDFPFKGQYRVLFVADNKAKLYINGKDMMVANENFKLGSSESYDSINISQPGKFDVKVELDNVYHANSPTAAPGDDVFRNNPCGVVLEIRKSVNVATDTGKSWTENPIGVSGILVPPPCPKKTGGKGTVQKVVINDPGTGFTKPEPTPTTVTYPVVVKLVDVLVDDPGINYNCAVDEVVMEPDYGYQLKATCGPFGTITKIDVIPPTDLPPTDTPPDLPPPPSTITPPPETPTDTPTIPPPPADRELEQPPPGSSTPGSAININRYPEIKIASSTGINFRGTPVFEVEVIPPVEPPPPGIIQVTDLAGIKKTGYYNGKPYYGAVFYENGIKYAGWYATAGQPIQIYDTLQESIDATVTTRASAIQRQGSDVTSNDPRLNIPGTPENLT